MNDSVRLLTRHHVEHAVLQVIENAEEYAVLASAYLGIWADLRHTIEEARDRGVQVWLITRTPDGWKHGYRVDYTAGSASSR